MLAHITLLDTQPALALSVFLLTLAYEDGASPFNYLFPGIRELYARSAQHKKRLEQMRLIL